MPMFSRVSITKHTKGVYEMSIRIVIDGLRCSCIINILTLHPLRHPVAHRPSPISVFLRPRFLHTPFGSGHQPQLALQCCRMMSAIIQIPLCSLHAALAIGLLDVVLSETLRYTTGLFTHHRRRLSLFRSGFALVPRSPRRPYFIALAQIVLLLTSVWLELSLTPSSYPSATFDLQTSCYAYDRMAQAAGRRVPDIEQLSDLRLPKYIDMTGCVSHGSLHADALAGSLALQDGFPSCTPPLQVKKDIDETLLITGASIGYVGNWKDGDPFLAYGLAGAKRDYGWGRSNGFAPTSFFTISVAELEASQGLWSFANVSQRVTTNFELPRTLLRDAPSLYNATQRVNITCPSANDRDCYDTFAPIALALHQQTRSYDFSNGTGFTISALARGGSADVNDSSICVFAESNIRLDVDWVQVSHYIGEQIAREGPVATRIRWRIADSSCVSSLPFRTGKAYVDATARIHPPEGLDEEGVRALLARAIVVNGLNSVPDKEYDCMARSRIESSAVGRIELIVAGTCFAILSVASIGAAAAATRYIQSCPAREDPLTIPSLLATIRDLDARKETPQFLNDKDSPEHSVLVCSNDENDETRARHSNFSEHRRQKNRVGSPPEQTPGAAEQTPGADYDCSAPTSPEYDENGDAMDFRLELNRTSDSSTGAGSMEHQVRKQVCKYGRRWPESDELEHGRTEAGDGDGDNGNGSGHFVVRYTKQGDVFVLHVS